MRNPRSRSKSRGSQILEFAIVLPLMVALVVGIFDFGQAFSMRQKLNFAARDAARFGSTQPTNDLSQALPLSVTAIRDLADSDLVASGINDCGLGAIKQTGTLVWTATGTCAGSSTFTLTIDRGFLTPPTSQSGLAVPGTAATLRLISTHISISYPYQWHFNRVIQLLVPGATYAAITNIRVEAISPNQD